MTTIYALAGREPNGDARFRIRHYYSTEEAARAALPDLVLNGTLCTPIDVETIELHGPDFDGVTGGYDEQLNVQQRYRAEQLAAAMGHPAPRTVSWPDALHLARQAAEQAFDAEHERRRRAVERAAAELVHHYRGRGVPQSLVEAHRVLREAVDALREYAPAETIAPAGEVQAEQAPAPATASVRDELHKLAPLPWHVANEEREGEVCTATGVLLFTVVGPGSYKDDQRIAELLVQFVNGPDAAPVTVHDGRVALAEQAVLDAAREYRTRWQSGESWGYARDALFGAVDALRALGKPAGGDTTASAS